MNSPETSVELWRSDESLRELGRRLTLNPLSIRVVSFDFFDTLVSRLCAQPSDLFIEVGRRLSERGLLVEPMSPAEFRAARVAADERARQNAIQRKHSPEIQLSDIYRELSKVVHDPGAARNVEFEVERSFCYLNPAVASFVHYVRGLGLRTVILSDTYFTQAELGRLLSDHGLSASCFDEIFVSCQRGHAKWNGQLYHDVFKQFDILPSELLHLGDNLQADIQTARDLGVEAAHYYRTTPQLDAIFEGERSLRGVPQPAAGSLNSLRVMVARQAETPEDAFRDGALVFGPVLSRFADWAVEHFRRAGIHTVLALMREGELLGELVRHSAAAAGYELKVLTCYASRLATGRAGTPKMNLESAQELLEGCGAYTVEAVLNILGLGPDALQFLSPEHRSRPLSSGINVPELLQAMFKVPRLCELLETKRAASQQLAFEYLNNLAGSDPTVGVLDLGWSGTIQRNIGRILRQGGRSLRTVGCYLATTTRAGRMPLEGDVVHAYLEQDWARSAILPEVAITALVGSTDGYVRNLTGQVVPVLGPCEFSPDERRVKGRLRQGICAFQTQWLAWRSSGSASIFPATSLADLDDQSPAILYRLIDYPTKPEADRLGVLRHDENYFGRNYSAPLCDTESAARLRREGVLAVVQAGKCYWPQGLMASSYPRLVSALRPRWDKPLALGRLGAWHALPLPSGAITQEELASLAMLVNCMALTQVIFAGNLPMPLQSILFGLWQQKPNELAQLGGRPRLLTLGSAQGSNPAPDYPAHSASIDGDIQEAKTLGALRSHLVDQGNIALVLSHDLTQEQARALLNGVTPFLGPQGMVLLAQGRFDSTELEAEISLLGPFHQWLKTVGKQLGYAALTGPAATRLYLRDWSIFRRTPGTYIWNKQWALNGDDLACGELALAPVLASRCSDDN